MDALVSTAWLARQLALGESEGRDAAPLRTVDVRWYLDPARRGRDAWRAGHLPGAVFLDVDEDLSAPGGGRGLPAGRHPWPSEAQVARVMGAAGIGPGVRVVAYDDASGSVAARLWYVLRAHGHDDVERFREAVIAAPEVLEVHHVTGEYDYVLRVALRNRRDLERFLVDRLNTISGIARIQTSVVVREVKRTTALPIG